MTEYEIEDPPEWADSTPGSPTYPSAPGQIQGSPNPVLDQVRTWLGRFISTMRDEDLDLLALWAVSTHLTLETYTTPRLVIDSPVPGSGKTTTLEHLQKLCFMPLQAASISSPALLPRVLASGPRTVLMDEVDRNLDPKKDGVGDLIAIINTGYKRGAVRPVLVPSKDEGWTLQELPTYAPIAMAGNAPQLPEDTMSRCIRVLLMPDYENTVEESDWELIEPIALDLGESVAQWVEENREVVRAVRPVLPEGCTGRHKERWSPLARVAAAAGGRWPDAVEHLIKRDLEEHEMNKEDNVRFLPAHVKLLKDLLDYWPNEQQLWPTEDIVNTLVLSEPEQWGPQSAYGKALTATRMGKMLASNFKLNSSRPGGRGPRGYLYGTLQPVWSRMGLNNPVQLANPAMPVHTTTNEPLTF